MRAFPSNDSPTSELAEGYVMTERMCKGRGINLQDIFSEEKDGLKELLREMLQEVLEQDI